MALARLKLSHSRLEVIFHNSEVHCCVLALIRQFELLPFPCSFSWFALVQEDLMHHTFIVCL